LPSQIELFEQGFRRDAIGLLVFNVFQFPVGLLRVTEQSAVEMTPTPPSGGGRRFECDLVAEVLESLNETALDTFTTALIEVVHHEILVHLVVAIEQVIDDGRAERDGSFLPSAPSSQPTILRRRVRAAAAPSECADLMSAARTQTLPLRVLPLLRFPAVS